MSPDEIRAWRERLGLSESQAARMLGLRNIHTIFREYQSGKRMPAEPTIRLMRLIEAGLTALHHLHRDQITESGAMIAEEELREKLAFAEEILRERKHVDG